MALAGLDWENKDRGRGESEIAAVRPEWPGVSSHHREAGSASYQPLQDGEAHTFHAIAPQAGGPPSLLFSRL